MENERFFPDTPENLHAKPIVRPILAHGLPEGDDSGYTEQGVLECGEGLLNVGDDVKVIPDYDGISPYTGEYDANRVLPGGTDGKMYARESALVNLRVTNDYLAERYGSNVEVGVLDAFRSSLRQAAGFTRILVGLLKGEADPKNPDMKTLYKLGLRANGTFSMIKADKNSPEYTEFVAMLMSDPATRETLEELVRETGKDLETVLIKFASICASIESARSFFPDAPTTPTEGLPLDFNNNAHAGGGAIDMMLMVDGRLVSHVPFDYVGPEAAIEFTETDANFAGYQERVLEDPVLRAHVEGLGVNPINIPFSKWIEWKEGNRLLHHLALATGSTYYSSSDALPAEDNPHGYTNAMDGGETWHKEPGNLVRDPRDGEVVYHGGLSSRFPDSGNPGHALQRGVEKAVWGGNGAHEQLRQIGILE